MHRKWTQAKPASTTSERRQDGVVHNFVFKTFRKEQRKTLVAGISNPRSDGSPKQPHKAVTTSARKGQIGPHLTQNVSFGPGQNVNEDTSEWWIRNSIAIRKVGTAYAFTTPHVLGCTGASDGDSCRHRAREELVLQHPSHTPLGTSSP